MKYLVTLLIFLTLVQAMKAQNVGIGTNTPNASAQLDVSSTTKGLLAPRMTTAQRNAIASPAKGLLVYDTDLNALYHYNGSGWSAVGGGGGGFTLPFEGSVNLNSPGLKVTNAGIGPAIQAITTNEFGYALQASNTTNYGYSVYAYSRSPNAIGVYAFVDSSTGVKGESGKGIGVDAMSTDSTALRARIIKGANLDPVILATHAGAGTAVNASSVTGAGVYGSSGVQASGLGGVVGFNSHPTGGYGVVGIAQAANSSGVYGSSNNGTGVTGYSNSKYGVAGSTISGTALYGNSTTGYGLESVGKLKLSGGNTNPTTGAILTSLDASGNAVWKPSRIAFSASGAYESFFSITDETTTKIHFASESYDYGNNFQPTTSASPTIGMSSFVAPATGVYHFDLNLRFRLDDTFDDFSATEVTLKANRSGNIIFLGSSTTGCCNANKGFSLSTSLSTDARLLAGDIVFCEVYADSDDNAPYKLELLRFNGHLVLAE